MRPQPRFPKDLYQDDFDRLSLFLGQGGRDGVENNNARAVELLAVEATFEAERMRRERQEDQRQVFDPELKRIRYETSLAERRYSACDPDNCLIAARLEKSWQTTLHRIRDLEAR